MAWPFKLNRLLKKSRPSLFKKKVWSDLTCRRLGRRPVWPIPIPIDNLYKVISETHLCECKRFEHNRLIQKTKQKWKLPDLFWLDKKPNRIERNQTTYIWFSVFNFENQINPWIELIQLSPVPTFNQHHHLKEKYN